MSHLSRVQIFELGQAFDARQALIVDLALPEQQLFEIRQPLDVVEPFVPDRGGLGEVELFEAFQIFEIRQSETRNGCLSQLQYLQLGQAAELGDGRVVGLLRTVEDEAR